MSSTRQLESALGGGVQFQPTRALGVVSCPCEKKAAYIRNQALNAIAVNDVAAVARRFNKSSKEQTSNLLSAMFSIAALYWLASLSMQRAQRSNDYKYNELLVFGTDICIFLSLCVAIGGLPTARNTFTYWGTKNICRDWLQNHFDNNVINEIANLPLNQVDSFIASKKK